MAVLLICHYFPKVIRINSDVTLRIKYRLFVPNLVPIWWMLLKLQAVKQSGPVFMRHVPCMYNARFHSFIHLFTQWMIHHYLHNVLWLVIGWTAVELNYLIHAFIDELYRGLCVSYIERAISTPIWHWLQLLRSVVVVFYSAYWDDIGANDRSPLSYKEKDDRVTSPRLCGSFVGLSFSTQQETSHALLQRLLDLRASVYRHNHFLFITTFVLRRTQSPGSDK